MSLPEPRAALALELARRLGDPVLRLCAQIRAAERVVGADLLSAHAGQAQQERDDEPCPVLSSVAVHDHRGLRRSRYRRDGRAKAGSAALQDLEVNGARGARRVGRGVSDRVDLLPLVVLGLRHDRDMYDIDR